MRNVNHRCEGCHNQGSWGFILTMRNVNRKKYSFIQTDDISFILTMRNVNTTIVYQLAEPTVVLY